MQDSWKILGCAQRNGRWDGAGTRKGKGQHKSEAEGGK